MTTVGYGDVKPAVHKAEMGVTILSQVIGTTIFGYVIGNVVNIFLNLNPGERQAKQLINIMMEYLKELEVHKTTALATRRHYKFYMTAKSVFDENSILQGLPPVIRHATVLYLHRSVIARIPLLRELEDDMEGFLSIAVPMLRPSLFGMGEEISGPRVNAREMFFIVLGQCAHRSVKEKTKIERIYIEGSYFGEATLLPPVRCPFILRAIFSATKTTQVYSLVKPDFDMICEHYPDVGVRLCEKFFTWEKLVHFIAVPPSWFKRIAESVYLTHMQEDMLNREMSRMSDGSIGTIGLHSPKSLSGSSSPVSPTKGDNTKRRQFAMGKVFRQLSSGKISLPPMDVDEVMMGFRSNGCSRDGTGLVLDPLEPVEDQGESRSSSESPSAEQQGAKLEQMISNAVNELETQEASVGKE
mmetsp:Transcript_20412/g.62087  ORF Transcript_20412/g.62087 Transcript_20412/m.62087 type:complete len:413 (-) Transcript_20412:6965-8203(-)